MSALRILSDERLDSLGIRLVRPPNLHLLGSDLSRADSATKSAVLRLVLPDKETMQEAVRRCWPKRARHDAFTIAFANELRHTFTEVLKQPMPEFQFAEGQFAPMITDVPLGKKTYEYRMLSYAGHAEVLNSYAWRQLPRITLDADIEVGRVHRFGCCWSITEDDELAADHLTIQVETELGVGAKRAHLQLHDDHFAFGNQSLNLQGFLNHPNVPVLDAPLNAGGTSTQWKDKTGDEIVNDISLLLRYAPSVTAEIEQPDTVLMSPDEWTTVTTRAMGAASPNTSILKYLREAFEGVTFKKCNRLRRSTSKGHLASNRVVAYKANDKTRVGHVLIEPFRQREPMQDGLEKVVIATSGEGGTLVRQPYSMTYLDGVGDT